MAGEAGEASECEQNARLPWLHAPNILRATSGDKAESPDAPSAEYALMVDVTTELDALTFWNGPGRQVRVP